MYRLFWAVIFLISVAPLVYADGGYIPRQQTFGDISIAKANYVKPTPTLNPLALSAEGNIQSWHSAFFGDFWHDIFWTTISSILGGLLGLALVVLVEWLKTPSANIEVAPDMILPDGRKFLKVKVTLYTKKWIKKLFPWQSPASFARLKGYLIDIQNANEVILATYTIKWDTRPEPWDYILGKPRLELLPAASEPENFLPEDEGTAPVAVKHDNDPNFYLFEANYYVNPNQRSEKVVKLRLVFSSSSASAKRDFIITNKDQLANSFYIQEA